MIRKVWKIAKAGSLDNLKMMEEEILPPAKGEVLVEVRAIGLNFADVFAIKGLYSATPKGAFIPGLEFSGEILEVGEGVTDLEKGMRVMGCTRFGAYASHLNIDFRYVSEIPADWSFDEGASFVVQAVTAWYALVPLGNLKKGMTVLIHSAAGGVGILANRIAQKMGAYTIGAVGSRDKLKLLTEEGYNRAIVREKDFETALMDSLKNRELNLVLECVGGKVFSISYKALAPMGRMVTYGAAHFANQNARPNYLKLAWKYLTRPKIDPLAMVSENKSVMGFNLIWLYDRVELMNEILSELKKLDIGKPLIGKRFPFDQMPEALRVFQSGTTTGKVVVKIDVRF